MVLSKQSCNHSTMALTDWEHEQNTNNTIQARQWQQPNSTHTSELTSLKQFSCTACWLPCRASPHTIAYTIEHKRIYAQSDTQTVNSKLCSISRSHHVSLLINTTRFQSSDRKLACTNLQFAWLAHTHLMQTAKGTCRRRYRRIGIIGTHTK